MSDSIVSKDFAGHKASARTTVGTAKVPPHMFFLASAVFHYLGPAFAVLLFAHVGVLGVAWLRIASAAVVFAVWRRPWRIVASMSWPQRRVLFTLGVVLGGMNACFYLAISMLPLATVGAIEFAGPIILAAIGVRTRRNISALVLAVAGVLMLTRAWGASGGQPLGLVFAFANCGLFMLYVILGHRIAGDGGDAGIDRLGAAMLVALLAIFPVGLVAAVPTFTHPELLFAGIGVGICSSVIPYVCDQLAMARLSRATFALLLSLLPASATVIGIVVLRQLPSATEVAGIAMVAAGVAWHKEDGRLATNDERRTKMTKRQEAKTPRTTPRLEVLTNAKRDEYNSPCAQS